ncbi:hypothetical protein Tco_0064264 [Tanacetum coccineum]
MHITRPAQMKWLPKLMGYDNEVKYKKGVDNAAADDMSRVQNKGQLMYVMTVKMPKELSERIAASWDAYMTLKQVLEDLQSGKCNKKHYIWSNGKLLRKNKFVVRKDEQLRMDREELQVMAYLAKECLLLDPDAHPTMREVVQILLSITPDKSKRRNFSFERYQDYTLRMACVTDELQQTSNSRSLSSQSSLLVHTQEDDDKDPSIESESPKNLKQVIFLTLNPKSSHAEDDEDVVGTFGLRIRTRGDTMSGVENGTITVVEVIIGDRSGRKWAGIGRLEWLEWLEWAGIRSHEQKIMDVDILDWKDAFDERLMVSSSSTSEGPHRSVQPQPSYLSGPCRSEPIECSNCKVKDLTINRLESRNRALKARLRMLEARLEMERNPEDHACQLLLFSLM